MARAAGELARADILRAETPLGFVHPLVRDAVYLDMPAGERELQHGRAAEVLGARAARRRGGRGPAPARPAARRPGAPSSCLRAAAGEAARRGGPESAIAYLERALEEPPPAELRGAALRARGRGSAEMNAPMAVEHLPRRLRRRSPIATRAPTAAFALAQSLLFIGAAEEGGALARRAAAELRPSRRRCGRRSRPSS